MRARLWLLLLTLTLAPLPVAAIARAASSRVPEGFVGMNLSDPFFDPGVNQAHQLNAMVASGVENLRVVFDWSVAEPYKTWSDVPAAQASDYEDIGGVPVNFAATDRIVGLAAQRGMSVLPVVIYTPSWDAAPGPPQDLAIPASDAPYASYLQALIGRYGPRGSYWAENRGIPRRPIRMWQIWNEPNFSHEWPPRPWAPGYVQLLRAAHAAIKQADPGAKVVLAGMPNFEWLDLAQIYQVAGARQAFDIVAVHPYTEQPQGVIKFIRLVRQTMSHHGDSRKPVLATETGWNSSVGQAPSDDDCCQTTAQGQASDLGALLPLLARYRRSLRLLGFDVYTWVGQQYHGAPSFNFAGLFRFSDKRLIAKPAFAAFRRGALAIEECRRKASVATRCLRSTG